MYAFDPKSVARGEAALLGCASLLAIAAPAAAQDTGDAPAPVAAPVGNKRVYTPTDEPGDSAGEADGTPVGAGSDESGSATDASDATDASPDTEDHGGSRGDRWIGVGVAVALAVPIVVAVVAAVTTYRRKFS